MIGSTVMDPVQAAPGYTPNPDEPGMGTWWCPYCGDGKPEEPDFLAGKQACDLSGDGTCEACQ